MRTQQKAIIICILLLASFLAVNLQIQTTSAAGEFGKATIGTAVQDDLSPGGTMQLSVFTLGSETTFYYMAVYSNQRNNGPFYLSIYGSNNSRLYTTEEGYATVGLGWQTAEFASPVTLPAGTYQLNIWSDVDFYLYFDVGSTNQHGYGAAGATTYTGSPPMGTLTDISYNNFVFSIYAASSPLPTVTPTPTPSPTATPGPGPTTAPTTTPTPTPTPNPNTPLADASTIAANFGEGGIFWRNWQQKTFNALGLFWVFYSNHSLEMYSTSTNGVDWATPELVDTTACQSTQCSVWFDGTYVHNIQSINGILAYKRGELSANGTVTWGAEANIFSASPTNLGYPMIATDSDGYPWVTFSYYNYTSEVAYPYVIKSSTNNGTWTTQSGFPYRLTEVWSSSYYGEVLTPLSNGKMLAFYNPYSAYGNTSNSYGYAQAWNGTAWMPEIRTTEIVGGEASGSWQWGLTSNNDYAYLIYLQQTTLLVSFEKYTYATNSFGSEQVIASEAATAYNIPMISVDKTTGTLYAVWFNTAGETNGAVAWLSSCTTNTWTTPRVFVNDTVYGSLVLPYSASLSTNVFDYNLNLVFINGTNGAEYPLTVRFAFLPLYPAPPTPTPAPDYPEILNVAPFWQYLYAGNLLGFFNAMFLWDFLIEDIVVGVVCLLLLAPLYIRTKSLLLICIIWVLLGGFFISCVPALSALAIIFLILGIAGLLWRLVRPN